MSLTTFRNAAGRRISQPFTGLLARSGVHPNTLTLVGVAINLGAAAAVALGQFLLGGILVLVAGLFDMLDGALARASGRASAFGALLDSTCDRLTEGAMFFAIAFYYLPLGGTTQVLLAVAALVGSYLISYVRARAEGLNIECKIGFFTRPERIVVLILGLLLNQVLIALWILAVLTFATALQRVLHVWRHTRRKGEST